MSGFQPKTVSRLSTHIAKTYLKKQDYKNALFYFNQAVNSNPENIEAVKGKAFLLLELKRFHESQEYLRKLIEAYPWDDKLYCMLAKSLVMDEQYSDNESLPGLLINEAEDLLNEAFRLSENDEYYNYLEYSRLLIIKKEYEQAITFLQKTVELNPDFEETYLLLSGCYNIIGDDNNAITWSMKARLQNIKNTLAKSLKE